MKEVLTAAEMRAREHAAIDSGAVSGRDLMERAGTGVVAAMLRAWPDLAQGAQRAVVLCGPGNNGGDGFVVARLLQEAGWHVDVFLFGKADTLPPDAKANHQRWSAIGAVHALNGAHLMQVLDALAHAPHALVPVIDALFGLGQRTPLDEVVAPVNRMIDAWFDGQAGSAAPLFVSVDLPTGYDADSGQTLACRPLPCDLAITFHRPKPIHAMTQIFDRAPVVVDIGL